MENERLQRALRARLKEAEALRRVATLVAREHEPGAVLALVTEEVARHLEADTAVPVRYDAPDRATFVATWTAPHVDPSPFRVGRQIEPVPEGALARALETVAPARVDSYEGLPGSFAREARPSAPASRSQQRTPARSQRSRGWAWAASCRAPRASSQACCTR